MPVLDLKLYTTISVCVALVAFIYSCNIFALPFAPFPLQRWISITLLPTSVDNSQNKVTPSESVEYQIPTLPTPNSIGFDKIWGISDKSPGVSSSGFQPVPRKSVGSLGPFLTSLVNFLQKEK